MLKSERRAHGWGSTCTLACWHACTPASWHACTPACRHACTPACLYACLPACWRAASLPDITNTPMPHLRNTPMPHLPFRVKCHTSLPHQRHTFLSESLQLSGMRSPSPCLSSSTLHTHTQLLTWRSTSCAACCASLRLSSDLPMALNMNLPGTHLSSISFSASADVFACQEMGTSGQ